MKRIIVSIIGLGFLSGCTLHPDKLNDWMHLGPTCGSLNLEDSMIQGEKAYQEADYSKSEKFYQCALSKIDTNQSALPSSEKQTQATILNNLAFSFKEQGQFVY
ncbi:MAG: hypothetical protein K2X66_01515 [Cyanobacteria bacterium]|nr:hypothetical protein [Cyanobacteriota bacterium]